LPDATISAPAQQIVTLAGPLSGSGILRFEATARLLGDGSFGTMSMLGGALEINGTLQASSPENLLVSATVSGEGMVHGTVIAPTLSPGAGNIVAGQFTVDNFLPTPGRSFTRLNVDILGDEVGSEYDQVVALSSMSVQPEGPVPAMLLSLFVGFVPAPGQQFMIIDNRFAGPMTGQLRNLAEGTLFSSNGVDLRITYLGGDGNDVVLTVIPEPSFALIALGCFGFQSMRRGSRRNMR
jgi:hypothetical protein